MTLKVNKITGIVDMPNGITKNGISLKQKFTINDSNASLPDSAGAGGTATVGDFWWDSADESLRMYVNDSVGWLLLNITDSSGVFAAGASLYDFTEATFTSSLEGPSGPSLTQAKSSLTGPEVDDWKNDTAYFNVTGGIQLWTVPTTGTYQIEAFGAGGATNPSNRGSNSGGAGAKIQGQFNLTSGDKLQILVGQRGVTGGFYGGGGGGGTYVVMENGTTISDVLIIAGGGGGGGGTSTYTYDRGVAASFTTTNTVDGELDGSTSSNGYGGSGGVASYPGGGGAGWYSDGGDGNSQSQAQGGNTFLNGGAGGSQSTPVWPSSPPLPEGGFGGGGAGDVSGGGGGGYTGGLGGGQADNYPGGGGAGSYNSGSNQSASTGSAADTNGKVIITLL